MKQTNINKIRNEFFLKSVSVGHHNVKYTWMQIMLMILSCIRGLESFEEGANAPSPQTLRDRLNLNGEWLRYFHDSMYGLAKKLVKKYKHYKFRICIDETYVAFFGNRKKLNNKLEREGLGKLIHGYKAKTSGATGSFCFLVVSLCFWKVRLPIAIKMMKVKEPYLPWLQPILRNLLKIIPKAVILADRGFGKATWFFQMLEELDARYVVRIPLRKKENKNKVALGVEKFQYWMKSTKTKEKVLLTVRVPKDSQNRKYIIATNIEKKTNKEILSMYLSRWDIENIFKDSDRILLPTSSRNPQMRLWTVVVSFFLFTLWQLSSIFKRKISLRTFVKKVIDAVCNILGCIITTLGKIIPKPG